MTGAAEIVACTDGPLLVRGEFDLLGADGQPVPRVRQTVALCRCGVSSIKPFCDGTHKLIGFQTQPPIAMTGNEEDANASSRVSRPGQAGS